MDWWIIVVVVLFSAWFWAEIFNDKKEGGK